MKITFRGRNRMLKQKQTHISGQKTYIKIEIDSYFGVEITSCFKTESYFGAEIISCFKINSCFGVETGFPFHTNIENKAANAVSSKPNKGTSPQIGL